MVDLLRSPAPLRLLARADSRPLFALWLLICSCSSNSGGGPAESGVVGSGGVTGASGGLAGTSSAHGAGGSAGSGGGLAPPPACTGICNAITATDPQLTASGARGNVTEYTTSPSNGGACLYGETALAYFAAINVNLDPGDGQGQWQGGTICGQCFELAVATSGGIKSVAVRITDKCPDAECGIDLGGSAPAAVMADGFGRYDGTWRAISCAGHPELFDGPPSLFVKDGSNAWWSVVQIRNPMAAVTSVDWQNETDPSKKGTLAQSPNAENFLAVPDDVLRASARFRFTIQYSDGTAGGITLTSQQLAQESTAYPLDP